MTGTIEQLFIAVLLFVACHFLMAARGIRARLAGQLGETGYLGAFSLVNGLLFVWMLWAYADAPRTALWPPELELRWLPHLAMPVAAILIVCGFSVPNPTAVGGEAAFDDPAGPRGVLTITRHPVLWAIGLWAVAHLAANGDAASLLLFGGLAVLSFGGMASIDAKRRVRLGAAWGPFAMTTSAIPFLAVLQSRTRIDWAGIGWWRPGLGLGLWAVLLAAHRFYTGASPFPVV